MLDGMMRALIDPPLNRMAIPLARAGISADALTLIGVLCGLACAVSIATDSFVAALLFLAANRLCDGLDGAIARLTRRSVRGGFFDIVADFVFYGAVPLAFALHDPESAALPAVLLLFSFYVNGATFLAFAAAAASRGMETASRGVKTLYFTVGLAEGTETILFFALVMVLPDAFPIFSIVFSLMCLASAAGRVWLAAHTFK